MRTALGVGERVGNTRDRSPPGQHASAGLDRSRSLSKLPEYCEVVERTIHVPLPDNYPILGKDAFRTGTGVHAAAIIKAHAKGDDWLADLVYSGVPARLIGRRQLIEIGPMSGQSNVIFWLEERGIEAKSELVEEIFACAKDSASVLADERILEICESHGARP